MQITRLLLPALLALTTLPLQAEDWPQWRGLRGDGSSLETNVPTKWSPTENIKWKFPLPGKGHGSPIIVGQKIFLNTALEKQNQRLLLCLDRTDGKVLWQKEVLVAPLEGKHGLNSYASSTPASDGQRVFVTFLDRKDVTVVAYDLDGKELWRKTPGQFSSRHGWSTSPMVYGDCIIVNCDHDGDGYIVALKRETGDQKWRIDRPNKTRSYCNPTIFEVDGHKQMVLSGTKCVTSYNPDTGAPIWHIDGPTEQYVASMVYTQGVFCITAGFPEYHTLGISPEGKELWHLKGTNLAAYVGSPVAFDKWFFLASERGDALCIEAKTGKVAWSEKIGKHFRPSAIVASGNIYWIDDAGVCTVVKASDKFEIVSKNDLGEPTNASPIVSNGQLFIRTDAALYCIGN